MDLSNKLDQLIDEYLNENDKRNIQGIFITIPGHKGFFFIMDSFRLMLSKSATFSLSILFSFNEKTKKGKSLADKILVTKCFDGFAVRKDGKNLTYLKDFGSNKQNIIENAERIISGLFPHLTIRCNNVELKRTNWFTIQDHSNT